MRNLNLIPILFLASSLAWGADDAPKPEAKPQPKITDSQKARYWRTQALLKDTAEYQSAMAVIAELNVICNGQVIADANRDPQCREISTPPQIQPTPPAKEEKK